MENGIMEGRAEPHSPLEIGEKGKECCVSNEIATERAPDVQIEDSDSEAHPIDNENESSDDGHGWSSDELDDDFVPEDPIGEDECSALACSSDEIVRVPEEGNQDRSDVHSSDKRTEKLNSVKRHYTFVRRIPRPPSSSALRLKRVKESQNLSVETLASMSCCKKRRCFKVAEKNFLLQKIKSALLMSQLSRRQTLAGMFGSSGHFYFDGNRVCATFLNKAFGFSRKLQSTTKSFLKVELKQTKDVEGKSSATVRSRILLSAPAREAVISFLDRLASSTGDKMPDSNERHLPFIRKEDVYCYFKEEFPRTSDAGSCTLPSKNYFLKTWKEFCKDIKVRKTHRFSICETCERLKDEILHAVTHFQTTSHLLEQKKSHYNLISNERLTYKKKRDLAALNPSQYWSIIVDGADQTAFGLPHFTSKTKSERGHALKVKLVGILEHASVNCLRLLTMTEEHATGANHIVESIHRYLMDRSSPGSVAPTLYIQVDNCTRENKNRYFFAYIESLIRWRVFNQIEVSFLPIGHTHEDIDQAFSTTSNRLRYNNAITLTDLHDELRQCFNKNTKVFHMRQIINWSGLCCQEQVLTTVKGFSHYRYFLFRFVGPRDNNSSDTVECLVKVNAHDDWIPLHTKTDGTQSSFLKEAPDLLKTPPTVIHDSESKFVSAKMEVTKRIESEEARIPWPQKLGELKELRDSVFRSRKERFHWELESCIETSQQYRSNDSGSTTGPTHSSTHNDNRTNEKGGHPQKKEQSIRTQGYKYDRFSFVAVLEETSDLHPSFWIGKILSSSSDRDKVVQNLKVHWYQPYTQSGSTVDKYRDKYAPSYIAKGTPKEKAWADDIDTSAVLINFPCLLRDRRLPASVQKHLLTALPSFKN